MLKWFADIFALKESTITPFALKRLKVILTLSLPFVPMMIVDRLVGVPEIVPIWLWLTLLILSYAAFFSFGITRFVNRFYARDKYLDEWEVRIKHNSMAFAFQALLLTVAGVTGLGIIISTFTEFPTINLSLYQICIIGLSVVMAGMYIQIFYALHIVQPIERDRNLQSLKGDVSV